MLGPRIECPDSSSGEALLAPVVGRRLLGCDVGRAQWRITYAPLGDAALNWQRAASSNFLFRKGLLREHVERRRKRKEGRRGGEKKKKKGAKVASRGILEPAAPSIALPIIRCLRVLQGWDRRRMTSASMLQNLPK